MSKTRNKLLSRVGYTWAEMESMILEWNKKNPTPLAENLLIAQIRCHERQEIDD